MTDRQLGSKIQARRLVLRLGVGALVLGLGRPAFADEVGRLVQTLGGAPSYKVRVQAAAVLARMTDPRIAGALGRAATADAHKVVRAFAAGLLGKNPGGDPRDDRARTALIRAKIDAHPDVRAAATAALAQLDRRRGRPDPALAPALAVSGVMPASARANQRPTITLRGMGDKSGRAGAALRDQMRLVLAEQLRAQATVSLGTDPNPKTAFAIDGAIRRLDLTIRSDEVEIACAVDLILSRPTSGIVLIAKGEALVQRPKRGYRPEQRAAIEREAMENAVRSAHENLSRYLTTASDR